MTKRYVDIESYADKWCAEEDLVVLESTGIDAVLREEIDESSDSGIVYYIDVPFFDADRAAEVLKEYAEEQDQEYDVNR